MSENNVYAKGVAVFVVVGVVWTFTTGSFLHWPALLAALGVTALVHKIIRGDKKPPDRPRKR